MDKVLRRKGLWIGLGVMGLIFLCVTLCALGPLLMLLPGQAVRYAPAPYVQPPSAQEEAPQIYQGPVTGRYVPAGPLGIVGHAFRLLFKLLFFGLLLVLGLRLIRRVCWGPRHWYAPYWGPYYGGRPPNTPTPGAPEGDEGHTGWGPPPPWARRTWHHHRHHWGPPPPWTGRQEQAGDEPAPDAYTGPQE